MFIKLQNAFKKIKITGPTTICRSKGRDGATVTRSFCSQSRDKAVPPWSRFRSCRESFYLSNRKLSIDQILVTSEAKWIQISMRKFAISIISLQSTSYSGEIMKNLVSAVRGEQHSQKCATCGMALARFFNITEDFR